MTLAALDAEKEKHPFPDPDMGGFIWERGRKYGEAEARRLMAYHLSQSIRSLIAPPAEKEK